MLEQTIRRIVRRLFPELTARLHLPQWGRVEKVYPIGEAAVSTSKAPAYCVDVQVLNNQGKPDTAVPVFDKIPLPATGSGEQRGVFVYPKVGALVELGFILGNPDKPFIRTILVQGCTLPALGADDVLLARDADNYYRIDEDDNITERCQAIADRLATTRQRLKVEDGGKVWVGNEADNVLQLLSDLMGEVITIANAAAAHNHGGSGPTNAGTFTGASGAVGGLKSSLDPMTE